MLGRSILDRAARGFAFVAIVMSAECSDSGVQRSDPGGPAQDDGGGSTVDSGDVDASAGGGKPDTGSGGPRDSGGAVSDAIAMTDVGSVDGGTTPDAVAPDTGPGMQAPRFHVLAIGQLVDANGQPEIHAPFVMAATAWLTTLAAQNNFVFTSVQSPDTVTDDLLAGYDLILQLNYTPFHWNDTAEAAFEKYLTEGRGGWVGLHHAALYGPEVQPADEAPWTWFYNFIGQINFLDYIATFAAANVYVEEPTHPIFAGVPGNFVVTTDEWYKWDRSPRPNVHVLAHVDENSYMPPSDIKMGGDHPVIWTNDSYKARNLYIFIGHHPNLFQNTAYMTLLQNAIFWAAGK
jgi:type 1 glutamine amidotransferase